MMTQTASHNRPIVVMGPTGPQTAHSTVAEEVAVAMVYNGTTLAVMMASPTDLEEFALGFSLTEGLTTSAADLGPIETVHHDHGVELRMWLPPETARRMADRRRALAGPVGCGLCGVESLEQAVRHLPDVPKGATLRAKDILAATQSLRTEQPLHDETHAAHAAGFYTPDQGIVMAREDVGRHNALDKLAGALACHSIAPSEGAIVVTSRLSSEMIQKAALIGCPTLIAVSAPTKLGIELAHSCGMTLIARARNGGFEIHTHPERIQIGDPQ